MTPDEASNQPLQFLAEPLQCPGAGFVDGPAADTQRLGDFRRFSSFRHGRPKRLPRVRFELIAKQGGCPRDYRGAIFGRTGRRISCTCRGGRRNTCQGTVGFLWPPGVPPSLVGQPPARDRPKPPTKRGSGDIGIKPMQIP